MVGAVGIVNGKGSIPAGLEKHGIAVLGLLYKFFQQPAKLL